MRSPFEAGVRKERDGTGGDFQDAIRAGCAVKGIGNNASVQCPAIRQCGRRGRIGGIGRPANIHSVPLPLIREGSRADRSNRKGSGLPNAYELIHRVLRDHGRRGTYDREACGVASGTARAVRDHATEERPAVGHGGRRSRVGGADLRRYPIVLLPLVCEIPVPLAVTEKLAVCPRLTVWSAGER